VCGLFVMNPGVVFQSFEAGQCTLKSLKYEYMKGRNCGSICKSEFPCYTLSGTFDSNITEGIPGDMELFNSYWSHVQGCAFNTCGRDEAKNAMQIYNQLDEFYKQHGYDDSKLEDAMKVRVEGAIVDDSLDASIKVSCYGDNEGTVFMTYVSTVRW